MSGEVVRSNTVPSCPWCGERDEVEHNPGPVGNLYCGRCALVFNGTRDEWDGERKVREARKQRATEAAPA